MQTQKDFKVLLQTHFDKLGIDAGLLLLPHE
jgi:hypothetical protein